MLLVILGAGASADSLVSRQDGPWRPPLANELFDARFHELLVRYTGAVVLGERVRTGITRGESLEQVLFRLQAETTDPSRPGQILGLQFYLQHLLWNCGARWGDAEAGMNNYLTLVNDLEEWRSRANERIAYVTFNYDTMLEASLRKRFGWAFDKLDDYLRDDYVVLKVHGSANWMQLTDHATVEGEGVTREQLIEAAGSLQRRDAFIVAGPGTVQYALNGVVPAIAIPAEPKAGFVCPAAHVRALTELLPRVERVLCVGWRGADRSLLELLKEHAQEGIETTVVTGRPRGPNGERLDPDVVDCDRGRASWVAEAGSTGPCRVIRSGFSGFVGPFLPEFIGSM
jgi:hypothetical protein